MDNEKATTSKNWKASFENLHKDFKVLADKYKEMEYHNKCLSKELKKTTELDETIEVNNKKVINIYL